MAKAYVPPARAGVGAAPKEERKISSITNTNGRGVPPIAGSKPAPPRVQASHPPQPAARA